MFYTSKSIYLTSSIYPGSIYLQGIDPHQSSPASLNPVNTTTSWTVAKRISASYSSMTASVASTTFTTPASRKPDGVLSQVIGEGWVFGPYTGVFLPSTLSLNLNYAATTVNSQQGRCFFRIWKGANINGLNAELVFPNVFSTSISGLVTTTGKSISSSIVLTSSLSLKNEYLFIENAWGITTAGGANGCNVIFRAGSGSYLQTGAFEDNTIIINYDDNPGFA